MMALPSSSSSSSTSERKYHVFLSFRGEDTRNNFTSHLHAGLCRKKIRTFIDNDLHRGDEISDSLLKAIEESKIAIIIFSKGYATSRWCLEELAKIIECKNLLCLIVVPVFYHVDPSDVRNQTGTFGEAFVKHEKRFEQSLEKVQRWRAALTEAANLSGFDSNVIRSEAILIDEIVKDILKRLNDMSPSYNEGLVGIESSIREVELLLGLESNDVRIVGLWGMGGIGKTTLAREVYNKISSQFESYHFLNDVREHSEKHELTSLKEKLLSAILEDNGHAILESTFTKSRLLSKKILIVFDDVSYSEQIEKLIGDLKHFGPGSRIFITSRDKPVLKNCGVSSSLIYEVKELLFYPALQLFSRHAFQLNHPSVDHMKLSQEVVRFAKGVPLALKVLGGLLFDKTIEDWESAMRKLERNPDSKIMDVLKLSFDGLEEEQKDIFLHIACFFNRVDINLVIDFFDDNESGSKLQVGILRDKALISIADGIITMHDLLQEMGKKIVNQESKDPGERSKLWYHKDIVRVLKTNTGTKAIEGIYLDMSKIKDINLRPDAFLKMYNLRYLNFNDHWVGNKVHAPQGLKFDSIELRYFGWSGYPLKALPSNFDPENLISLDLPGSNLEQIFNVGQQFHKLKYINLGFSKRLTTIPNLSLIPNLKTLILESCKSLIEVSLSIQYIKKLVTLNLDGCRSLSILPTSFLSKSLTYVDLHGCLNLKRAPMITRNMKKVYLDGTSMTELPLIEYPSSLNRFCLKNCPRLESLPSTICKLQSLYELNLSGCSNLNRLPDDFGNLGLSYLSNLLLDDCQITKLPESLGQLCNLQLLRLRGNNFDCIPFLSKLSKLRYLDVSNCKRLQFLSNLPSRAGLRVFACNCTSLEVISDSLFSKKVICLGNCSKLDQNMLKAEVENTLLKGGDRQREILFPGNEIPEWFIFQNMGSSITLKIPPDYKLMFGRIIVAVCFVVTFQDNHKFGFPFDFTCKLIGRDKYGKTNMVRQSIFHTVPSCNIQPDHVILGCNIICPATGWQKEKWHCGNFDVRGGSLTFDFYSDCYEVKKCAVKLL